jgi:hypothetical protein
MAALAGCPPPPRYLVTDVIAHGRPINDAVVAARCPGPAWARFPAVRTDDTGRATLPLRAHLEIDRCIVVIAKPGLPTVEVPALAACPTVSACPPLVVELGRSGWREVAQ